MLVYLFDLAASRASADLLEAADQASIIFPSMVTLPQTTRAAAGQRQKGVQFKSCATNSRAALTKVCRSLAAQIVADGEGCSTWCA
jgi:N-acetylglutamate synthase/N-acetylornithine aminotransferase